MDLDTIFHHVLVFCSSGLTQKNNKATSLSSPSLSHQKDQNPSLRKNNNSNDNRGYHGEKHKDHTLHIFLYLVLSIVFLSLFLRAATSFHPHSGQNKPPMYGDFEAQRHWMEITANLPLGYWYHNSTDNDLMYWGLDYPPLTAYHSWINGKIASILYPPLVELQKSRGIETPEAKLFMRMTVIACDLIFYFPAVIFCVLQLYQNSPKNNVQQDGEDINENINISDNNRIDDNTTIGDTSNQNVILDKRALQLSVLTIVLLHPALILIDHGHFQYNNVSLGLTLYAIGFVLCNRPWMASLLFTLAFNYKQMALYFALPFFSYLLGHVLHSRKGLFQKIFSVFTLGIIVLLTTLICWIPLIGNINDLKQILHRVFPFYRGLFEDKVSNFWCSTYTMVKWNRIFDQSIIIRASTIITLLFSLPSNLDTLIRPTKTRFLYCLMNTSFSFFLFSYHVHEKTILFPLLPTLLLVGTNDWMSFSVPLLTIVSTFSMYPLIVKDKLQIVYVCLVLVFCVIGFGLLKKKLSLLQRTILISTMKFMIFFHMCNTFIKPPERYPDLFTLICTTFCFLFFFSFFIYTNFIQIFRIHHENTKDNKEKQD